MIKFLWAIVLTIVSSTSYYSAKAQFTDDFSDGDFLANPPWTGNDSKFLSASGNLKLVAPAETSMAFLSTTSRAIGNASWQFKVHLDFNPSGSNYARVYLLSDQPDLSGSLNGYFVLIGGTPDEVSLYQQSGLEHSKIIDGSDKRLDLSVVDVAVRVIRDSNGNWELYSDVNLTGEFTLEGTVNDVIHVTGEYFGVSCEYTSTRSDKFSFDDFIVTGEPYTDNSVPANFKDVVITEIFADPAPRIELPEVEFIEIFNRSSNEFNLSNWTISDGTSVAKLSNKIILPGEYVFIVSSSSIDEFSSGSNLIGVPNFPSLNNTEDVLILKSAERATIDSIHYFDSWYKDSDKREGGWSLEIIDPNNPCGEEDNWLVSEDESGGTPGSQNSVNANKPDLIGPILERAIVVSDNLIRLEFNEKLAREEVLTSSIEFEPALLISNIFFSDASLRSIDITLASTIQPSVLYTTTVNNVRDCNLNLSNDENERLTFALPEEADSLDIVINEILFNPRAEGVDFIELYNNSPKYISMKNWEIANLNEGTIENGENLTATDLIFYPYSYKVFTIDRDVVAGQYPQASMENFLIARLPSLPDNEGSVAIINHQGKRIDAVKYSRDFHSPLIKEDEGVSLERVSFSEDSNNPENWKSASTTAGYATPGYLNSNTRTDNINMSNSIQVDPEIFQPVYGQPNFTQISYKFDQGGYILNAKIFDAQGRLIKTLANSEVLGTEGFYTWLGDRDDGTKARLGYYFACFEVFNLVGDVQTFRKRIVLSGDL